MTALSFKRSNAVTAEGMRAFSSIVNLEKLDLERCPGIHGGFVHLQGLSECNIELTYLNFIFCSETYNCVGPIHDESSYSFLTTHAEPSAISYLVHFRLSHFPNRLVALEFSSKYRIVC